MNKIHSKVWNKELGQLVVASEFAKSDSAGVVQGAGAAFLPRRTLLAVAFAPLIALAGVAGSTAFAQEWTATDGTGSAVIGDGGTVTFQGDGNINAVLTGDDNDATLQITLDPDLVVDSVTTGNTVMDGNGVAVGANVVLASDGLSITNGPSVTLSGINAGNNVITGVADGTASDHAVNLGQLDTVGTVASSAQSAADAAQSTADEAWSAAATAQSAADAAADAANAGWIVTDGGNAANIGPNASVTFGGDSNISVVQSGSDGAGAIDVSLNPDLDVTTLTTGNTTVANGGLTINGGPSVTSTGIDAGGSVITSVGDGAIAENSQDAVTGGQLWTLEQRLYENGGGVKYFHANSNQADSEALGEQSVAIGPETIAAGDSSFAAGDGATTTATAGGAIALGQSATVGTEGGAVADGDGSIAIGRDSHAGGNSTLAVGDGAGVEDERVSNAMAVGTEARVSGMGSNGALAAGYQAHAGSADATAVGAGAYAGSGSATALGATASATGGSSIAIGQARAAAGGAIAAGTGAYAGTARGIAVGSGAGVGTEGNQAGDRTDHIAIGTNSGRAVVGNKSTAIGYGAGQGVTGDDNVAIGTEAGRGLQGNNNISIGRQANDGAGNRAQAVAIGDGTEAGSDSVALGSGATASGSETLALGKDSSAGSNGVAVGAHATAEGSNIALGRNSSAWESDVTGAGYLTGTAAPGSAVSVGSSAAGEAFQRRIVNVADGAQRFDAVNVGQLRGAQQAVANLVGGNVTVESNGTFGGYVIELQDTDGNLHQYGTVAEAINAVSSGDISVLPGNAVIYNPDGTITVAAGQLDNQAVNVGQLNAAIDENGIKYFSANTTEGANRNNDGATGIDAMAIGPSAVASGGSSLAIGHAARVNAGADNGVAIGHDVSARAENATVLGNRSHAYGQGGVAIGHEAVSQGRNSVVLGTGAEADPRSGGLVDNAIVIGTVAEVTANDGIAVGQSALASEERAVAQGFDAHAMARDSQAFGTRARSTGANSQASGTDAAASGSNAIATGTRASASGANAIASGTGSRGYASDGIAIGTGAVSGAASTLPEEAYRNINGIAIGNGALADNRSALALGVEAQARAESATAIGDGAVATADAEDGLVVGSGARVTERNASAFGQGAEAVAVDALAVGAGARASAGNASAFGQGAQASHAGSVALGSNAVTATAVGTSSITVDGRTYGFAGTSPVATVSVGGPGAERTITNVAAGRIGASSTDAINGSQLHGTNMALEALADDLDTAGQSLAGALGGASSYDPATHQVSASLSVGGNTYTNVQDALTYVGQGWDVSAEGGAPANVAPGGSVDFSNDDGNIEIARSGTDLTFDLADDLEIGSSVTVGETYIDGDHVTTNNLTVEGETRLGDNFVVNNAGDVTYNGSEIATQDDGLSFAGNTGGTINKALGDNTPLTISGGLAASEASTGANLRVDSDGSRLNLTMARDLTDLDSITLNNGGPVIDGTGIDMGGKQITGLADGTEDDHAVNLGQLKEVEEAANAGWNVSVDGEGAVAGNNVGPDGVVDFSNDDGNIEIDRTGTDLSFNLADDLEIGNSITVGDTTIDGTGVGVGDDVRLGDTGLVITGGPSVTAGGIDAGGMVITHVAPGVNGTDAVNVDQLAGLAGTPLTFAGDAGTNVDRVLGETVNLLGGATDEAALTGGNIGVVADGADTLVIKLNKDIDLGGDGSLAIGDARMDADGLAVTDAAGNTTTVAADGTTVADGAGNGTAIGAGTVAVTDATGTTTVGGNMVSVGGANPIVISGATGTIGGLTNTTFDPDHYSSGQAATEDQLGQVYDVASAGWNVSAQGENATNVAVNSDTGNTVDLNNADGNIVVTKADDSNDVTFDLAEDIDLGTDGSLTTGNTVVDNDGVTVEDADGNVATVAADGTTVVDGAGNGTTIAAGTVAVTDAGGTTTIGGTQVVVGGASPITIDGGTGTIGGLGNRTIDYPEFADGSGRAATEEQLEQVNQAANAGWNLTGSGADEVNIGPDGSVDVRGDSNITVAQTGVDQDGVIEVTLNRDLDLDSVTVGDTFIDATGVAIGTDVHLGQTGLVIDGGPSVTVAGIDAGSLVVTNVAAGTISATSQDAVNGSQLHGMGDSITSILGGNAVLNPDGTIVTSDIGGTGYDNIDDAIRSVNDAATAGWTATDATGNDANVGPNGVVTFVGDDNVSVRQTGTDGDAVVEVTLDRDLDVDSVTAGDTVLDADGVSVGDDVHLGDTGLVIEGGPSVTTDGIDAGGGVIRNVAAGVEETDAVNVGQLNELAGSVSDNDERVTNLENGASGPFQVSQESGFVPPAPTGGNSAAGGSGAVASGGNSTALGNQAVASGDDSTAIGQGAQATHDNSVALGQGSATTVGAQAGYDAAYVGTSDSAGEVNVGNRTISGVAPGSAGTDAVNVDQLNAGVNNAVVTANAYTDQRFNQIQGDVWNLHGRVDELEKSINSGVATAMAMRQAPYVAGATTYYAGVGAYKGEGALGVSLRRTSDNGRWSLEGGFSANRDGTGGYIGVSGVLGGN